MKQSSNQMGQVGTVVGNGKSFVLPMAFWICWPALFVFVFRDAPYDFVGAALREHYFYPPSLNNVTGYWMRDAPVYKPLYLSVWCVNAVLIAVRYCLYLIEHPHHLTELEGQYSVPKLMALGTIGLVVLVVFGSGVIFDPARPLVDESALIVGSDVGLMVGLPMLYMGWACSPVVSAFFFYAVFRKLVLNKGEV